MFNGFSSLHFVNIANWRFGRDIDYSIGRILKPLGADEILVDYSISPNNNCKQKIVRHTGFEPVTSALSRQRSKPTELIAPERMTNISPVFLSCKENLTLFEN